MQSFTYWNTTRIHFGKGQIARISEEVPADARVHLRHGEYWRLFSTFQRSNKDGEG